MDKISVVIPVYNGENCIRRTINNVLKQTYSYLEIIIVDDGSIDKTEIICRSFTDKRISYYKKDNGGPSDARNFGLEKISGDFVCFLDADDDFQLNHIEHLYKNIVSHGCDFCSNSTHDNCDKAEWHVTDNIMAMNKIIDSDVFGGFLWNKIFITRYIKDNHLKFNIEFFMCEDLVFVFEYLKYCQKCLFMNTCTYNYHEGLGISKFNISDKRLTEFYAKRYLRNMMYEFGGECFENLGVMCIELAIRYYCKLFFVTGHTKMRKDLKQEIIDNYFKYRKRMTMKLKTIGFLVLLWSKIT